MSIGNLPGSTAASDIGEACERAYDSGVEQITLGDEELIHGLGLELRALIDEYGVARDDGFVVSKVIRQERISTLTAGEYGQELVHRLEVGLNSNPAQDRKSRFWTPNMFSVNQYKIGDSIQPHNDCLAQGILRRAEIRQGLAEESEEIIAADEDVYLDFIENCRNPSAHDYILQVLGRKTLKYWPGDKLYKKPMSQEELGQAIEVDTSPGDLTIVRKEVLSDDKLPITHSVPTVLEDGMSLVLF